MMTLGVLESDTSSGQQIKWVFVDNLGIIFIISP